MIIDALDRPSTRPSVPEEPRFRALRACTLLSWVGGVGAAIYAGVAQGRAVFHAEPWPIWLLMAVMMVAIGASWLIGGRRVLVGQGPGKGRAYLWAAWATLPALGWASLAGFALMVHQFRLTGADAALDIVRAGAAAALRLEARLRYPDRIETARVVMHQGAMQTPAGLPAPVELIRGDAEAADALLAEIERQFGRSMGAKIHWVRGPLPTLGMRDRQVLGIVAGSDVIANADRSLFILDEDSLTQAALGAYFDPHAPPPTMLIGGWVEARAEPDPAKLAVRVLELRETYPWLDLSMFFERNSGGDWYLSPSSSVPIEYGAGFVSFLLRRGGPDRFLRFAEVAGHVTSGDAPFEDLEAASQRLYGVSLEGLEGDFWRDTRRLFNESRTDSGGPVGAGAAGLRKNSFDSEGGDSPSSINED